MSYQINFCSKLYPSDGRFPAGKKPSPCGALPHRGHSQGVACPLTNSARQAEHQGGTPRRFYPKTLRIAPGRFTPCRGSTRPAAARVNGVLTTLAAILAREEGAGYGS